MKKIGIVGGGITGVTCAYKLQEAFEVTLFEKETRLGGHARTVRTHAADVEVAVSVFGELTYEEFFRLMNEVGFDGFRPYPLRGLRAHDGVRTHYYFDTNLERISRVVPGYLRHAPFGPLDTLRLVRLVARLHDEYRRGLLDDVLVQDLPHRYPGHDTVINTVVNILSLITSVQIKSATVGHVMNFVFDRARSSHRANPFVHLLRTFARVKVPTGGVGAYMARLRDATDATFVCDCQVTRVGRNANGTVTVETSSHGTHTFDAVIICTQPYQVHAFLDSDDEAEHDAFNRLGELVAWSMVTNHTDFGAYHGVQPTEGLVDFRLDTHDLAGQTTITRLGHYYTAQTLPEAYVAKVRNAEGYVDTAATPDNYSVAPDRVLSQHLLGVQHVTPETAQLLDFVRARSGDGNLHFACAALSDYPVSQEGGVRAALKVIERLMEEDAAIGAGRVEPSPRSS